MEQRTRCNVCTKKLVGGTKQWECLWCRGPICHRCIGEIEKETLKQVKPRDAAAIAGTVENFSLLPSEEAHWCSRDCYIEWCQANQSFILAAIETQKISEFYQKMEQEIKSSLAPEPMDPFGLDPELVFDLSEPPETSPKVVRSPSTPPPSTPPPSKKSGAPFEICPYCLKELNLPETPAACPYCRKPFRSVPDSEG